MGGAVLGISAYYHDSAAAVLADGVVVAAAQEERFTRRKHDPRFPSHAVRYVLEESGHALGDLEAVVFYEKPLIKFERLLETYHGFAPRGLPSFMSAIPVWIKEKLFLRGLLRKELAKFGTVPRMMFPEHHLSHACSAFYPSPFEEAAILTLDGVGEWATTTIGHGDRNGIRILRQLDFPHSIGLLYSAFTYYCGFRVNSGEYKLMGLAPYGDPGSERVARWKRLILEELVSVKEDGSFLMNMEYFDYATGLRMCNEPAWERLFGLPCRRAEGEYSQEYMDMALAIQQVTEDIVLKMAATTRQLTGSENLVLAGGVALNCVANGKLLQAGTFKNLWIQPAAGDAGGALGAAYAAWHIGLGRPRSTATAPDAMRGAYLGPEFHAGQVQRELRQFRAVAHHFPDFEALCDATAAKMEEGSVIGWFQGRMEYGPRALGGRSIIADPRNPEMQKRLNLKIKYREGFRPFAPSVLEEDIGEYFDLSVPSPYMLLVAPVREARRNALPGGYQDMGMYERLYHLRSDIPAITHVDYSARVQSVARDTNERYWRLISAFKRRTGFGVIVNTSFNVRGEPIVCTPTDAYRCFMRTEMDCLVVGDYLLLKSEQPPYKETEDWRKQHTLD